MYAVIVTGGKQYRVQSGQIVRIDHLPGAAGSALKFDQVLMVSEPSAKASEKSKVQLGKPTVANASVEAQIVTSGRDKKIIVFKMKRRKGYRKTQGHRQSMTEILITAINGGTVGKTKLSGSEMKSIITKYTSSLKPKGKAFTPKTLGSRKRLAGDKASPKNVKKAKNALSTAPAKKETAAPTKKAGASTTAKKAAPAKKTAKVTKKTAKKTAKSKK